MKYYLIFSFLLSSILQINAQTIRDSISNADLDKTKVLDEVVVESSLEQKRGLTTTNVFSKEEISRALNTGDLLGNVDGFLYNKLTSQLTYLGSSNIAFLVDGIQKDSSFLVKLNPKKFFKCEVTVHPIGQYAQYDVVVNFITLKNQYGYSGNIGANVDLMPGHRIDPDNPVSRSGASGSFTYTTPKWNFEGYLYWSWIKQSTTNSSVEKFPSIGYSITKSIDDNREDCNKRTYFNAEGFDFTVGYNINQNHLISFYYNVIADNFNSFENNICHSSYGNNDTEYYHENIISGYKKRLNNTLVLYYRGNVNNWKINSDFGFKFYNWKNPYELRTNNTLSIDNKRRESTNTYWGVLSTDHFFSNGKSRLEISEYFIGAQSQIMKWDKDVNLSTLKQFRNSLYARFSYFPSQKVALGLTGGMDLINTSENSYEKTSVGPHVNVFLQWSPSSQFSCLVNYTNALSYASLSSYQDYGYFLQPFLYKTGNPELKTALWQDIELTFDFLKDFKLRANYNWIHNATFEIYSSQNGEYPNEIIGNYVEIRPESGSFRKFQVNLSYNKFFAQHWNAAVSANVKYVDARYHSYHQSKWTPYGQLQYSYIGMNNTFIASFLYMIESTRDEVIPQGIGKGLTDEICIAIQKTFLNNRLRVVFGYSLPLHFANGKESFVIDTDAYYLNLWGNNQWRRNNRIQLGVEYTFNGGMQTRHNEKSLHSLD